MDPELNDSGDTELSLEEELANAIGLTEEDETAEPALAESDPAPAEPGAAPADPAAAPEKPAADPAKPDPSAELYAPLPEHNPRKTHERFAKLVEGHKTVSQERDTAVQEREQLKGRIGQYEQSLDVIREMGFTDQAAVQDLQQFSEYRKALSSGNVDAAIGLLQQQIKQLSLSTGRRIDVNPLDAYQDLNQSVAAGSMDEAVAMELARSRHTQQLQQQAFQRSQQEQQQVQQHHQTIHSGARQVDQVVQQLQRDPDYKLVEPELMKELEYIRSSYHPDQWAREIKRTYETKAQFMRLQQAQQAQRSPTPIRANGHAGGRPAPANAGDAVLQALGLD